VDRYAIILVFVFVISVFGMSHLNLSDADKSNLATKPKIYQAFIQFCRVTWIIFAVGCGLFIVADGCSSRGPCDYDSRGEHCDPY